MSGSLIVPENIPGIDVNPTMISQSASTYRSTASSIGSGADAVLASWSGLGAVYSAPESGQLLASMDPVGVDAHTIESKLTSMSGLLDTLADEVAAPVRRLKELKVEAEEFVASVQGGVTVDYYDPDNTLMQANAMSGAAVYMPEGEGTQVLDWSEHSPSVERNNELLQQVAAEAAKLSAASAECVNGINALRDDMCFAPVESISAEQFETAKGLPWGEAGQGDRSCSESIGDGMWNFGEGLVGGVVSLAGFDIHDGWSHDWGTAGKAWGGMASTLGALAITGPITIALDLAPDEVLPDWAESVRDWHTSSVTALGQGIVGTPEQWQEDPVSAGTTAVLNIATFFIPGGGIAAGSTKAASAMARVGLALERGAVRAGDGTLTAAGLTRAGTLATSLSDTLNFLTRITPGGTKIRDLDAAVAGLDDIPPLQADNLVPATVDAPTIERGSTDASASTASPGETTVTHSEGGSTTGGGTTVLDRTDLGDNGMPGDHGGSGDVPADRGGADDVPIDRGDPDNSGTERGGQSEQTPNPAPSTADVAPPTPENRVDVPVSDAPGPRTPFAARTDLDPNTVYHVEGRGDFYTDATGRVTHVDTSYGGTGNLNADLMRPQPDTTYVVHPDVTNPVDGANHDHVFRTDSEGRTEYAHTDALTLGDADRSGSVQSRVGDEGGTGYDGGHLFGNGFGGGGEYANLVAMLRDVNRGSGDSYFNLENQWRAQLTDNPNVRIEVDIQPHYPSGSPVPDFIEVEYAIDGGEFVTRKFVNE